MYICKMYEYVITRLAGSCIVSTDGAVASTEGFSASISTRCAVTQILLGRRVRDVELAMV